MDPTSRDDPRLVDAVRSHTDRLLGSAKPLPAPPRLLAGADAVGTERRGASVS